METTFVTKLLGEAPEGVAPNKSVKLGYSSSIDEMSAQLSNFTHPYNEYRDEPLRIVGVRIDGLVGTLLISVWERCTDGIYRQRVDVDVKSDFSVEVAIESDGKTKRGEVLATV